jgi:magnesium transporter
MLDDLKPLYERILDCFEAEDPAGAAALLAGVSPADAADVLRGFDRDQKVDVLRHLEPEDAAQVLAELDERSLPELLDLLEDQEIVGMLDTLDSDDAADLVGHLDEEERVPRVVDLLDEVDHQDAVELSELLRYPEDSAGGIMAKEFLTVREDQTVGSVVATLQKMDEDDLASHHYVFVVDRSRRLLGRIALVKLLMSEKTRRAGTIMETDPISVAVMEDQERVANIFRKQDLISVPVVDEGGRMVGKITVDDAIDVMTEEATEDVARFAGSSREEVGETSVLRVSRARLPWLLLGLLGEMLSALVMSSHEEELRAKVILAFFVPMVMATGGNTGIQTSSIMIRLLATEEFDRFRAGRHLLRELLVGLLNGLLLGALVAGTLQVWRQEPMVGTIIGLALMSVVLLAATVGTVVPFLLDRLRIDPTVATGPFITTTNDVLGILVYLGLANWLLGKV